MPNNILKRAGVFVLLPHDALTQKLKLDITKLRWVPGYLFYQSKRHLPIFCFIHYIIAKKSRIHKLINEGKLVSDL